MRADDFHNGTMYAAFMLPCCLGRGSDRSSQFGMEEFATATGGLLSSLFAHQSESESVSLCVIMWRWRDVEKIQLSQRVTMDRREGAQRSPSVEVCVEVCVVGMRGKVLRSATTIPAGTRAETIGKNALLLGDCST